MKRRNFLHQAIQFPLIGPFVKTMIAPSEASANEFSGILAEPLADPNFVPARTIPVYRPAPETWSKSELTVAWIGHSTVLINFYGIILLTDPVLFDRVGLHLFGATFGISRLSPPALPFAAIPKPDVVLLSHAHMDHCDIQSLKSLTEKYPGQIAAIIAKNTRDVIEELVWKSVQELDWNEETSVVTDNGAIRIKGLEVRHFGWRLPGDLDRANGKRYGRSFNAYLLEREGKRIVFGGDTALTDSFSKAFQHETLPVDIAIMPIGAYQPWKTVHCNPEEALQMARDMKALYFVPIHCQTFPLGRESTFEPLERLQSALANSSSPQLAVSAIGKTFVLPRS